MVPETEVKKQPEPLYYPLRFRLQKDGQLRYISHLDFVRTMTKALVRAKLPLWFTLGFNPIPKITFAAPLSVLMDSDCELMDVRMKKSVDPASAKAALSAVLPPHLTVLDCYTPNNKLSDIGYLAYDVTIAYEGASEKHAEEANQFMASPSITVTKKGKGDKLREVDIKPMVASFTLDYSSETGEIHGRWVLSASPSAFLNPELVLDALRQNTGLMAGAEEVYYAFCRREVYAEDMSIFR